MGFDKMDNFRQSFLFCHISARGRLPDARNAAPLGFEGCHFFLKQGLTFREKASILVNCEEQANNTKKAVTPQSQ